MDVVIIKYNGGNVRSVDFALQRLGVNALITDDFNLIQNADKVIFPGVGEASGTMKYLQKKGLDEIIRKLKQPVLGICLGMQLLCRFSEEGSTVGLGIFDVDVKKFDPAHGLKIPHMGWNKVEAMPNGAFDYFTNRYMYFVHSYYVPVNEHMVMQSKYGIPFSAAIQLDNFYGVQFHPEKSGDVGSLFLQNFLSL